jgi:glycosyltransferase involved in cell wall biosynthesis
MNVEVLMSCMAQDDWSIVKSSMINGPSTIINQCNEEETLYYNQDKSIKMINTKERGLSKSRNMAIKKSSADICILADDDETFVHDYSKKIKYAFKKCPDADIIVFNVYNWKKPFCNKIKRLNWLYSLKISSVQIVFKRSSILKNRLHFDEKLGAGTNNGAGEETKFVYDCFRKGLRVYYYPEYISRLNESESTWFQGYDSKYFTDKAKVLKYIYGKAFSSLYGLYFLVTKNKIYHESISFFTALKLFYKAMFDDNNNIR